MKEWGDTPYNKRQKLILSDRFLLHIIDCVAASPRDCCRANQYTS